jgi:hypothetical protein
MTSFARYQWYSNLAIHLPPRSCFRQDLYPRVYLPDFMTSASREFIDSAVFFDFFGGIVGLLTVVRVLVKDVTVGPRVLWKSVDPIRARSPRFSGDRYQQPEERLHDCSIFIMLIKIKVGTTESWANS